MLMISDFVGGEERPRRPKRIEPLERKPQKSIHELAAEHDAREAAANEQHRASSEPESRRREDVFEEPVFTPPDMITETATQEPSDQPTHTLTRDKDRTNGFLTFRWTLSRKWTIIAAVLTVLLIGGGGIAAYYLTKPGVKGGVYISKSKRPPKPEPKITTVASSLSGLQVDPAVNERPVIGVMIENSLAARPQSGLDQASVVFEAIAEGGVTRFLALFQDTQPDYIGPVRSARPYFVQWCMSFDCAYGHAGGSPEALANIRQWGTKDLPDTRGIYWRASNRYSPHNLYSSSAKLSELAASRGYGKPTFTGFTRKADQPLHKAAPAQAGEAPTDGRQKAHLINLNISSGKYNARFDYDATSNSYKRSQGGAAHIAVNAAGQQTHISARVVVALVMQYGIQADRVHSVYNTVGNGQAYIFQDGSVVQANWSKTSVAGPLVLTDANGNPIALNAGKTWITALGGPGRLSYQ
ncbi:hypothetical protein CSA80_02100 [Candidatus Saccharibacteria bacterium]|nr:MAG: hypothetical protein CR973_02510 [Candidatus Saccharibacteria bacterium]PID99530.1 MAG: hypothetical protein CSA80_02100 [Candidatus Saccharibacteria bacterium]